jgi:hypothetical protein
MKHFFKYKAHDLNGLFDGVKKLSTFIKRLEDQAQLDPLNYPRDQYVGDGFEFFIEALLTLMPHDNRIGVSNYEPVQSNDNGCDGLGVNLEGKKCAIQVKFRGNRESNLTSEDKLAHVVTDAQFSHSIVDNPKSKVPVFYVFTTAKGLHHYTDAEFFKGRVRCLGYNELKSLVDNNIPFWDALRKRIQLSFDKDKLIKEIEALGA